jgi:hypothetical protein
MSLLEDLFLPEAQRLVTFPAAEARFGVLPGATQFDGTGVLDDGNGSVLCLLGAAWVHQDYMRRIGERLAAQREAKESGFPFTFTLVGDKSDNIAGCPGVGSKRNRCTALASTSLASIIANPLPMQTRGPPPNGR